MFCTKCGHELPDQATLCPYCGANRNKQLDTSPGSNDHAEKAQSHVSNTYDSTQNLQRSSKIHANGKKSERYVKIAAIVVLVVMLAAIFNHFRNPFNPGKIKETGTHEIQLGETIDLPSIKSSIRFIDFIVNDIDYSNISASVDFVFAVDLPNKKSCEACAEWLNEFQINGTSVDYEVGIYWSDMFVSGDPENIESDSLVFWITYPSDYKDQSYVLECAAGNNLNLRFVVEESFWDIVHVDSDNLLMSYQYQLDKQYGITAYDLREEGPFDFEVGNWYKLTGKVISAGKYLGELTDKYQISFGITESSWLGWYYCYFTEEEWNRLPKISSGDVITIYGRYDYNALVSDNFNDCTSKSLAGTFILNENGEAEVIP